MVQSGNYVQKKKSTIKRILSIFIAVLMLMMCIPASTLNASALGLGTDRANWDTASDIMTNVSVQFQDTKYRQTTKQETGQLFYLYLSLAGNSTDYYGEPATYTIELTDSSLLLPNFDGNGLINGAQYNGFTLTVEKDSDGSITRRYITYDIANGQTKEARLHAKFANGITPNGASAAARVSVTSSSQIKTAAITAAVSIEWASSKSASSTTVNKAQLDSGVPISYTIKAYPNYTSDKLGNGGQTQLN